MFYGLDEWIDMPTLCPTLIEQLDTPTLDFIRSNIKNAEDATISAFFDARGMPCPMPLLKAKIALRSVADGESLYLVASDKNSQTDLVAFCQKNHMEVQTWQGGDAHNAENCFHFIITKIGAKKASV